MRAHAAQHRFDEAYVRLHEVDPELRAYFDRGDHLRDWARLPDGGFEAREPILP